METKKRLKTLSVAVCFIFALFASPAWADSGSAHVSGASDSVPMHISGMGSGSELHVSGAGSHGKSEGSKSKKHHSSYSHQKEKHDEGSKGRTWGRGTYNKGHGYPPKHSEGSGKKYSGHYAKGHGEGSSREGYGHKSSVSGKHGEHSHYKKDPFEHVLKFKRQLGLTEAQVTEIKNQQFEFEKVSIRSHAAHKIAHMELDRVIHSENVDEAKARHLAEVIAGTKAQKIKAMVEGKLAVMRVLTADQKRIITRMYNRHN